MQVEVQKEHQWLLKMLGEWTYEAQAVMAPDQPPCTFTGTEKVRSIGDVWVMCEGSGDTPDGNPANTIMTLGYDPAKQRFVGTFIGSMMTNLWIYDGSLDPASKVLTLDAEGPSMTDAGTNVKYQDMIEFISDDHRTLSSQILSPDGKWVRFMTSHYRKVK